MNFEQAVEIILQHEGGYVMDSHDPGGETKYGISKRQFPNIDIKNLTKEQAKMIYKMSYWDKCQCEKLPKELRLIVFDCAINQGQPRAIIFLQRCLGVFADGMFGPNSWAALNGVDTRFLIGEYAKQRLESYCKNLLWKRYGQGWTKRLVDILIKSLTQA